MLTNAIALKLVEYIVTNDLQVGARLPSIRELATLWECNPSQVRTGLITLAALGVIDMHPRAGSFVRQLAASELDNLFILFFRLGMLGKQADTSNIYAVKSLLDKEIFLTAIKYRTESDLFDLESNLERQAACLGDCDAFIVADEDFHLRLAEIIRNPVMVYLLDMVQVMLRPYRHANLTSDICRESYESHRQIYQAVLDKDEARASEIAVLHTLPRLRRLAERNESGKDRLGSAMLAASSAPSASAQEAGK